MAANARERRTVDRHTTRETAHLAHEDEAFRFESALMPSSALLVARHPPSVAATRDCHFENTSGHPLAP
jgi:hypothetical protein